MYKLGDKFTIQGKYKRRTLLQWLRREPKELQEFVITHVCDSWSEHEKYGYGK